MFSRNLLEQLSNEQNLLKLSRILYSNTFSREDQNSQTTFFILHSNTFSRELERTLKLARSQWQHFTVRCVCPGSSMQLSMMSVQFVLGTNSATNSESSLRLIMLTRFVAEFVALITFALIEFVTIVWYLWLGLNTLCFLFMLISPWVGR
jgi:hypothetical protein